MAMNPKTETATLAGGCFWCLDAVFRELRGVRGVVAGYAGGSTRNPTYQQVCSGDTGHAEVAQVTFDPSVISFEDLLRIFFSIHDPTTPNRQGADAGTQYRSAVFHHSLEQKAAVERVVQELTSQGVWRNPIVTQSAPLTEFYPAEGYHQDYFANHPGQPYCQAVISPKLAKFRKLHFERLRR